MTVKLTECELEVLQLRAEGYSIREIQDKLFLSDTSVKNYSRKAFEKLGARNIQHAIYLACKAGLI